MNKGESYLEYKRVPCGAKWKWPKPNTPTSVTPLQGSFKCHCRELMIQVLYHWCHDYRCQGCMRSSDTFYTRTEFLRVLWKSHAGLMQTEGSCLQQLCFIAKQRTSHQSCQVCFFHKYLIYMNLINLFIFNAGEMFLDFHWLNPSEGCVSVSTACTGQLFKKLQE